MTSREELAGFAVNLEMWWPHLPRLERVERAAALGFSHAEIWFWPAWDIAALAQACRRHQIAITQIGGWDFEPRMCDAENHARFRDAITQAVTAAQRLDARLVNVNGPYLLPGDDRGAVRSGVVEALRTAVPVVEEAGMRLMVEPMNPRVDHPGYSLPTSEDVIRVCEEVGSDALGINWDLYHLQISEGDLTGHLAEGMSHVAYVQAASHPGRNEPGLGEVDYRVVFDEVRRLGYDGVIGLECTPRDSAEMAVARIVGVTSAKYRTGST